MPGNPAFGAIIPCAGPLTDDMETLELFMKTIIDAKPFRRDATAIDVPWRPIDKRPGRKLRLGLISEDPLFPLHPPIKDMLAKVVHILNSHGHEVVMLKAAECRIADANEVAWGLLSLEKTAGEIIESTGEPPVPSMRAMGKAMSSLDWRFLSHLSTTSDLGKFAALQKRHTELGEDWRKLWVKHDIDAVISPSAQTSAVEHDTFGWPAYTAFLNILDVGFSRQRWLVDVYRGLT